MNLAKRRPRLLLVDDELEFLAVMRRALERRGFTVFTASGAAEAIDQLEKFRVDVAVFDVKMPGLDGLALFRIAKRRWPRLPVIILTGHGRIRDAFQTSREGVFDYLSKPCDPSQLAALAATAAESAEIPPQGEAEEVPDVPIRVLHVDDDAEFLATEKRVLERRGFEVETVQGGGAAMDRLGEVIFDVVLLDLHLPAMDGIEVLRAIKRHWPSVEVILLTGHPSVPSALEGVREGAFDFVAKPVAAEVLAERIRAAWHRRHALLTDERREEIRRLVQEQPD